MKFFVCTILCFTVLTLAGYEPWHDSRAAYRMVVELRDKNKDGFWLDEYWLLPVDSGFAPVVYAEDKKLPQPRRGVVPKSKDGTVKRFLYFGYANMPLRLDSHRPKGAPEVRVLRLEGRDGKRYPLIRRVVERGIALDKSRKVHLLRFSAAQEGVFTVNDEDLPVRLLMFPGEKSSLKIEEAGRNFQDLPLRGLRSSRRTGMKAMDAGLELLCNDFVFAGDKESIRISVWSEHGRKVLRRLLLDVNGVKQQSDTGVSLPVAPGSVSAELTSGTVFIDRKAWRCIPLAELPELQWKPGCGFFTKAGEQVTIQLARPDLHGLRKWSFWRNCRYVLSFPKKTLHIRLPERDPLQNGLLKFYRELRTSRAVEVKLELPAFVSVANQENWKRERGLAAFFELMTKNTPFLKRTVILPAEPDPADEEYREWLYTVQRLCREYDLRLLAL